MMTVVTQHIPTLTKTHHAGNGGDDDDEDDDDDQ